METCPDCGAPLGGSDACQALMDEIAARAFSDPAYGRTYNLGFDAYCMQHPRYTRSARSYAAHLARLCCGLEFGGDPGVYAAIQSWLDGSVALHKPAYPATTGARTVADLQAAWDSQEHHRLVQAWAQDVWSAYADQHSLARGWVRAALERKGKGG